MSQFLMGEDSIVQMCERNQIAMDAYHAHSHFRTSDDQLQVMRVRAVEQLVEDAKRELGQDALPGTSGIAFARQLEHILAKVSEEKYKPNDALRLYKTDSSIPAGKTTWTARRRRRAGKWSYISNGNPALPGVQVEHAEKTFRILPAGQMLTLNIFENMSAEMAGINLLSQFRQTSQMSADEFVDNEAWRASVPGMSSILDYPFAQRILSATPYNDSSTAEEIKADLLAAVNLIHRTSQGTLGQRVRIIMPPSLEDYLNERYRNAFDRQSILEGVLDKNKRIESIETAYRLEGAGTGGRDVILIEMPQFKSIKIPRGVTFLPPQRRGFNIEIPAYMLYGGVFDEEPMATVILEVQR